MRQTATKTGIMFFLLVSLMAGSSLFVGSAEAGRLKFRAFPPELPLLAQNLDEPDADPMLEPDIGGGDVLIRPREAARIAKSAYPGSKVLKVKLLPSGVYAVTLRGNGSLTRVMVDGQSGDIL